MNRITPFVKRLRTNGGTIYTFSSAVEDIGLNINERNNVVKISHFALLDIPPIDEPDDIKENKFNVRAIAGAWEYEQNNNSIKDGKVLIAESFQNYALNLESNLLNKSTYNATLTKTVSERVFWKWLKETGAIRWDKDISTNNVQYWSEEIDADGNIGYNSVVKYVGQVSAGNIRSDSFGTYNETYVLVPTSHGQTDAYFKLVEDDNYHHGMEIGNLGERILGRENYTLPHPDVLSYLAYYDFVDSSILLGSYNTYFDNSTGSYTPGWWFSAENIEPNSVDNAYLIDSSSYINDNIFNVDLKYIGAQTIEFRRSKVDCLSLVFDLNELKNIYGDPTLTYDRMAMEYAINDSYNFNSVLIYYSVYNSTMDQILSTNLLGVLFLDAPTGNTSNIGTGGITIPSLEKIQSGTTGFGTSYSLRVNIKTDNMIDDTQAVIVDFATSDQLYTEDWSGVFANLETAVNILTQNNSTLNYISTQYGQVRNTQTEILNELNTLEYRINDVTTDIQGTANTIAMFADGDDPLVESSIYMKFGNIGINTNDPQYPLDIRGITKTRDIIIENAIKDTSGNVILGYGSPLQIGSSTNFRDVVIYVGNPTPALYIDASYNNVLAGTLNISGGIIVDGSSVFNNPVTFNAPIESSYFNFDASYIATTQIGIGLTWDGNYLNIVPSADVSAYGSSGWVQYNFNGAIYADSSLFWNKTTGYLGIGTDTPSGKLHVAGDIYATLQNVGTNYSVYYNPVNGLLSYGSAGDVTKSYVDGSLAARDITISNISSYAIDVSLKKASLTGATFSGAISASNLSNTNTGDETTSTIKTKLGAATGAADGYATSTQITKLNGIADGAEVNVNADWNAGSGDAFIANKPIISGSNTGDETKATIESKLTGDILTHWHSPIAVSINSNTSLDATYNKKVIDASGNITLTLANGIAAGVTFDIINVGIGDITISATTLQAQGSKNRLTEQYAGCSVMSRGSNVWWIGGNLTA